jgi:hypothetical protein
MVAKGGAQLWGAAPRVHGGNWAFGLNWVMTGRAHVPMGEGLAVA